MLPQVTIDGTVVADPELRYSASGVAVAKFRVVANSRKKNEAGEWENDKTLWMEVTAFKQLAENVVESLVKGDKVIVTGRLQTDEWENDKGEKRSKTVMIADMAGPSLQFRTVPHGAGKTERVSAGAASDEADPWKTPVGADEPPF